MLQRRRRGESADERLDRLIEQERMSRAGGQSQGVEIRRLQLETSTAANERAQQPNGDDQALRPPQGAPEVFGPDAGLVPLFEDLAGRKDSLELKIAEINLKKFVLNYLNNLLMVMDKNHARDYWNWLMVLYLDLGAWVMDYQFETIMAKDDLTWMETGLPWLQGTPMTLGWTLRLASSLCRVVWQLTRLLD